MRCAVCMEMSGGLLRCRECGARLIEAKHRELMGVRYLLGQITRWEQEGALASEKITELRARYEARREGLMDELRETPPAPVPARPPPPPPPPQPRPPEKAPTPPLVRPLPPPRDVVRNLFSERNIRWLLSIGIGIFCVALAIYVRTQWRGMSAPVKVGILFGATAAAAGGGAALRRTTLRVTGTALVVLAAIALPIDFLGVVQFELMPGVPADAIGWGGSLVCLAAYVAVAAWLRESSFAAMALVAGTALASFTLRLFQVPWAVVPTFLPALMLAGAEARARFVREGLYREPLRWGPPFGILAALTMCAGLLIAGELDLRAHYVPLQAALGATLAAAVLAARRSRQARWTWAVAATMSAMFGLTVVRLDLPAGAVSSWEATFGAVLSFGWIAMRRADWRRQALPFVVFGSAFVALSIGSALVRGDLHALTFALTLAGAQYLTLGWTGRNGWFWGAGAALGGMAMLTGLLEEHVQGWGYPLPLALYGFMHVGAAAWWRRRDDTFYVIANLAAACAAGAALVVMALYTLVYFNERHALGVVSCALAGLVFGALAAMQRSRHISDVAYGAIGFAAVYALRGLGMQAEWVGVAVMGLAFAYFALERWIQKWLLRPTLSTAVLATIACVIFAAVQVSVTGLRLQPALVAMGVGAFYLAAARSSRHPWLAHVGTYLLAGGGLLMMDDAHLRWDLRAAMLMPLPAAGMLWAWWEARRERLTLGFHLAISSFVVLVGLLAFGFLDLRMYRPEHLPGAIGLAVGAALIGGFWAFARPERLDTRAPASMMAFFAALAYILTLKYLGRGTPWGPLVVFAFAPVMCGAAALLRSRFPKQAGAVAIVSAVVTCVAVVLGFDRGTREVPSDLYVAAGAVALYGAAAWHWRSRTMTAYASVAIVALAVAVARFSSEGSIGVAALALGAAEVFRRRRQGLERGPVLASVASAMVAVWVTLGDARQLTVALGAAFALYAAWAWWTNRERWLGLALFFAVGTELSLFVYLRELAIPRASLCAMTVPIGLFVMAWFAHRQDRDRFSVRLLLGAACGALLATAAGFDNALDRVLNLLAISGMAGMAALYLGRPRMMYAASASLMAANVAAMIGFKLPATQVLVEVAAMALVQALASRALGGKAHAYSRPFFILALLAGAGVIAIGLTQPTYVTDPKDCLAAVGGLLLTAGLFAVAGRSERKPAYYYLSAINVFGAYLMGLHRLELGGVHVPVEAYTAPLGAAMMVWNVHVLRDQLERRWTMMLEALALGVLTVPSLVVSFEAGEGWHVLMLYGLALAAVLAGMMFRRKVYLFGGTAAMVVQTVGKVVQFLVRRDTSWPEWGMIVGAVIILLAALFESRKAGFVRERMDALRVGARKYLADWR
ncbi:MAG: hypothetical protein HYY16_00955 [Planctomycetes bacterium]|nr:hypothetical protein [Planctomycetota bacterium]